MVKPSNTKPEEYTRSLLVKVSERQHRALKLISEITRKSQSKLIREFIDAKLDELYEQYTFSDKEPGDRER